ncbi:F-box domain-containing protein [Brazilian cedratvirus IHUMI]|uniref:F-box domain-containing protein n=1 Tax=Brazilian cedratvirus IHUMI TaxID=2126980 RepID=A0A2R8FD50_9VIRU|nr:F-box domain-containing protein [Brazilian cedratvirus IHUMI]
MQDINNILPEEVLCIIFDYVSCYMSVTGSVCREWQRISCEFEKKPFLLLAYIYKDEVPWLKKQWSLPEKVGKLSSSTREKMVDSVMQEANPNTLVWLVEGLCDKRELFNKAAQKKNYRVLNWMKAGGLIDSEEYLDDLIETFRPFPLAKFYMGQACCTKEEKELLFWYVSSKLPLNKKKVLACFNQYAVFELYNRPHWKLSLDGCYPKIV